MRPVHVSIRCNNNPVVAKLRNIHPLTNPCPHSNNQRLNFVIHQHFIEPCAFYVQDFSSKRQNSLEFAVSAVFRRTSGAVSFHDVNFTLCGIFFRTVGRFSRKRKSIESALSKSGVASCARSKASFCSQGNLLNNASRVSWMLF